MVNERMDLIHFAGGETVQVRFDLTDEQLLSVSRAAAAVRSERYMGVVLDADAVLEMRELTALHDSALERARDGYSGGTLVLTIARLGVLLEALREWAAGRLEAGRLRPSEAADLSIVESLLDQLGQLYLRGLQAALGADSPACSLG